MLSRANGGQPKDPLPRMPRCELCSHAQHGSTGLQPQLGAVHGSAHGLGALPLRLFGMQTAAFEQMCIHKAPEHACTPPPRRPALTARLALRLSPKPGALTAHTLTPARSLFTIRVASASAQEGWEGWGSGMGLKCPQYGSGNGLSRVLLKRC